jgi:hypothetical protein
MLGHFEILLPSYEISSTRETRATEFRAISYFLFPTYEQITINVLI